MKNIGVGIKTSITALTLAAGLLPIGSASAVEDVTPFQPGATIGLPLGFLPQEGIYMNIQASHWNFDGRNAAGNESGSHIALDPGSVSFLWVTGAHFLGASYAAAILQPARDETLQVPAHGINDAEVGAVNTILTPGILSWNLGNGLYASTALNVYLPDGSYEVTRAANVGRNYWTVEPRASLSYLANGWKLSANLGLDFNSVNNADTYHSGDVFGADLTATRKFGQFEIGVGSTIIKQFTDDTQYGAPVPAGKTHGLGNRADYVSLGPVVGYDFGKFTLMAWYQASVVAENTAGGDQYWLRLSAPIYSGAELERSYKP